MNYYYDVKLNFLNKYYNFYEWNEDDLYKTIKKIPIFNLDFNDYKKIIEYSITVDTNFLNNIKNKTIYDNGVIKYACIFTDKYNAVAIIFNENGKSSFYSSLSFDDELSISEISYTIKKANLEYEILDILKKDEDIRSIRIKKEYIIDEIKKLYTNKNIDKLKYLYYELYKKSSEDANSIYKNLIKGIKNASSELIYNIYNLIKISYKNV